MEFKCGPLSHWPVEDTRVRRRAAFQAGYQQTLNLLVRELRHLATRFAVLELDAPSSEFRIDGWPRANARIHSPRVVLSIECKHGSLRYPCDTFINFRDNVRAIALGLEALRRVDRYGISRRAEQYKGWTQLPPPNGEVSTEQEAFSILARHACPSWDGEHVPKQVLTEWFRAAAMRTHPDHGGDAADFMRVQRAREFLKKKGLMA